MGILVGLAVRHNSKENSKLIHFALWLTLLASMGIIQKKIARTLSNHVFSTAFLTSIIQKKIASLRIALGFSTSQSSIKHNSKENSKSDNVRVCVNASIAVLHNSKENSKEAVLAAFAAHIIAVSIIQKKIARGNRACTPHARPHTHTHNSKENSKTGRVGVGAPTAWHGQHA